MPLRTKKVPKIVLDTSHVEAIEGWLQRGESEIEAFGPGGWYYEKLKQVRDKLKLGNLA